MWWWIIPLAIVGLLIIIAVGMYNSLVVKRNKVNNQWSQVDVQLKRRIDLIPNLVESVKGYATHEKSTFDEVTEARTKFQNAQTPADKMNASGELSGLLSRLFAVAENYPDLKANVNFINLQEQIAETEDKISFARQFYNDTVMDFNNSVQMFPSSIFASIFGFKLADFFKDDEMPKNAPEVKF